MGLAIGCPYFRSEKRKTITCEGCIKYFQDIEKKKGHLKNICENNYDSCNYNKSLNQVYVDAEKVDLKDKSLKLKSFYLEANRKAVKHLIQQIGIMDKTIERNIQVKQLEIDKLRAAVKVSDARSKLALLELQAMMHKHGIESIDLGAVNDFINLFASELVPDKENPQIVKLVVKEREQNE